MKPFAAAASLAALALAACGSGATPTAGSMAAPATVAASSRWIPTTGESYQIQYDGKLDLSVDAQIYDLDMFDTKPSVVATLHAMNRKVMCYV
ncbi:MAG: endo alpha-1,4 polygalactosaminidase, partial [Candidatus Cybelea sp.]